MDSLKALHNTCKRYHLQEDEKIGISVWGVFLYHSQRSGRDKVNKNGKTVGHLQHGFFAHTVKIT